MNNKKLKIFLIASTMLLVVSLIVASLFTFRVKKMNDNIAEVNEEIRMSLKYTQVTNEDEFYKVEGTDYVKFGAYFTRDLNGDGIAEKLLGSCRELNQTDALFLDLNVLSNGSLKDGKIVISASNFKYSMSMIKDSVLAENYLDDDVKEIKLNEVHSGTQKLILGNIVPDIKDNINNYTGEATITLTGTHVNDVDNTETNISKTIKLNVDWHGYINAWVNPKVFRYNFTDDPGSTIDFDIDVREQKNELLLKKNEVTAIIPEFNEYAPVDVKVTNDNVEYEYNNETRELRIVRTSTVEEDGKVTNSLPSNNIYKVEVTYPRDSIDIIDDYTIITVPVSTYFEGYNNNNEQGEFENPYVSNIATDTIKLIFDKYPDQAYNFFVKINDKKLSKDAYKEYVVSKQDILNCYDSDEEITSKEYTIEWKAVRGSVGDVSSMVMMEPDTEDYADKWDETIIEDYTANVGVYFRDAKKMLSDDGELSIYNNETNELIKTFSIDELEEYTASNPYRYGEKVKHIRVETSSASNSSILYVYNIKELDVKKIVEDFTKDEVKSVNYVYSYLNGICKFTNNQVRRKW